MIYLDNAATTLHKPPQVAGAMREALARCANPGRGGHAPAALAEKLVYRTRERAAACFHCEPEQICFTSNATEGLNIALGSLVGPGDPVLLSGLEHNAVTRTLAALGAELRIVRAPIFDQGAWLEAFRRELKPELRAVVCTHVSNVFGAVLPVGEIGALCAARGVPFVVDASQSAGLLPLRPAEWGAAFTAMPGHKGLLGPQGTGILICRARTKPLRYGGTGTQSALLTMPEELPERLEAGTLNVPGICGLGAALDYVSRLNPQRVLAREQALLSLAARGLEGLGARCFTGPGQLGVLSFRLPGLDCEEAAARYSRAGVALRAGLHCAPEAHRSAGTFPEGTLRLSLSCMSSRREIEGFLAISGAILGGKGGN